MSTSTLKERKEAFVSGLRGTSITEIYLLSAVGFSSFLLRCSLLVCLPSLYKKACNSPLVSISIDFGIIIFPVVLVFTVLTDYVVHLLTAEILISGVILWNVFYRGLRHYPFQSVLTTSYPKRQPYLTLARTSVNLFTAIAILAVDFSIFPRRLAKTETYGSGLMDIGVGAFLMAHGLTSPESRQHHSADSGTSFGYLRLVATTLKQVLPLLLLGLLRVMVIKSMGYQEHVTEYGVHWNFFFTIATVRLICSLLYPLLVSVAYGYGIVAIVVALSYQALLQWAGLESYVLFGSHGDGSRIGLISANREGLVSCAGYFVIYAGWIQIGKWLLRPRQSYV